MYFAEDLASTMLATTLGLEFDPDKTLHHHEVPMHGYEIHHGRVVRSTEDDWLGVGIRFRPQNSPVLAGKRHRDDAGTAARSGIA